MARIIKVLCVGPATNMRGGISRIIEMVRDKFPHHIQFCIVTTYSAYTGLEEPDREARFTQAGVFVFAVLRVSFAAIFSRDTVFHVHLAQGGSTLRKGLVCVLLRLLRCRYIVHCHAPEDSLFCSWVPKPARHVLLWGIGGAQCIIALTQVWSDYYARKLNCGASRIIVLPNPVELPISIPDRTDKKMVDFVFLGRIGARKGAFDLIRAFASLPDGIRQRCHLTLAGDGDTVRARTLARELGCATQTSVIGWVGREEVHQLLALSDVFVLPSRGEGMSMALLEGMAWGLAIVSTAAGGASEFLQHNQNSLLVEPGDVQGIAAAICELAQNRVLRLELASKARETASRFSLDKYVRHLTRQYEGLALGETYMAK